MTTLQQPLFALHPGFMQGESINMILEEDPQEKTSTLKSSDRQATEDPPFNSSLLSALCEPRE
jgi:hypothetical protein